MFNKKNLDNALKVYKENFTNIWKNEMYKWKAVKHFQDNWNIDSDNFEDMFEESTSMANNLLASQNFYPRGMILDFAKVDQERTRSMFKHLFDETKDLKTRINFFREESNGMKEDYGQGRWASDYQNTNAISTYLWLMYPDKYYIYKYTEYSKVAKFLESSYKPLANGKANNVIEGKEFYDLIRVYLQEDEKLTEIFRSNLSEECYEDRELITLTIDLGYFISVSEVESFSNEWYPSSYNPNITTNEWLEMLEDNTIFYDESLKIMKRMLDNGGMGTCTELANKYGELKNFYNKGSSSLAKRVADKVRCEVYLDDEGNQKWWPILFKGKKAPEETEGSFTWKIRDELIEALEKIDLTKVNLYSNNLDRNFWWLSSNPKIWSFDEIGVGEEQSYTLYNENGNKRRIFRNFLEAKKGDIIIGYESSPTKSIVALAEIVKKQDGEKLYFAKTESLINPISYSTLIEHKELENMEFIINPQGSLFKLKHFEFSYIMDLIREVNEKSIEQVETIEKYNKNDFLDEVFMSSERYDKLTRLIENKKNIILQGAPGVGKTYSAKRLAYSIMGKKDDSRIKFIQFHQNYSYEDFIMGYKPDPNGDGFILEKGIFHEFCQKAENNKSVDYFFIIDEINRGNLSKIFGELLYLIENTYRGKSITLAYSKRHFKVPENLYIIGMMNTADRSLAMIDYALRRRFSFFEMLPGFETNGFRDYQYNLNNETFNKLIKSIEDLNVEIINDDSLGKGFTIGHSYFCNQDLCTNNWMKEVVEFDVIPMLQEYWFDDSDKLAKWKNNLKGIFND